MPVLQTRPVTNNYFEDTMKQLKCGILIFTLFCTFCIAEETWTSPFLNNSPDDIPEAQPPVIKRTSSAPIRILITRPVTKYGTAPLENKWILLLCEHYLYFRLLGIESIEVIPPETLVESVPEYMEYKLPIPVETYQEAAKKVSAEYIIYLQCEYSRLIKEGQVSLKKGTEINFFGKVLTPTSSEPVLVEAKQFSVDKLGTRLDSFLALTMRTLDVALTDKNRNFLETAVLSSRGKRVKKIGEHLAAVNESTVEEWDPFIKKYRKVVKKDADMLLGYYAGAEMCRTAGKYLDGATLSHALMDILDAAYPRAFTETSLLYRLSGKYDQAWKIVESMPPVAHLQNDIKMEKAFLYEQKGDVKKAADMALEVLKEDSDNIRARQFYRNTTKSGNLFDKK